MAKKKITHLDLFSGIGGFHLGFEKAGFKVKSYFSEIDKHAIAVYKHQFKDSEYVGSVTDIRGEQLPKIDLITFGSPCQDFSLAGKRKGMGGERSSLVLEAIRLIDECRPSVFIWENVKGTFSSNNGADFAAILQAFANIGGYRLEWQLLNTSWVLPQNRERVYLVGYSTKPGRNWRGVFPIGEGAGENTKLPRQQARANTLTTRYGNDTNGSYVTERKQYAQKEIGDYRSDEGWRPRKDGNCPTLAARAREDGSGQPLLKEKVQPYQDIEIGDIRYDEGGFRPRKNGIAPALVGSNSKSGTPNCSILKIKSATKKGYEEAQEGDSINLSNPNSETRRGRVGKGKAQTLDTAANQAVVQPVAMKWERTEEGKRKRKENRDKDGKDYTSFQDRKLTPSDKPISNTITSFVEKDAMIHDTYRIRRLTPIECERLQGFQDNHTEYGIYDGEVKKVSNTQRYKQCGNAVTVDIVALVAEAVKPLIK